MAKRFTDTTKWHDPWFSGLPDTYKLFWLFILDHCNEAGIWKVNMGLFSFYSKKNITLDKVIYYINDGKERVVYKGKDKLLILGFAEFQYGSFRKSNHPFHKKLVSLIDTVPDTECDTVSVGYGQGVDTLQDKDKDKDKVKTVFKEKLKIPPEKEEVILFCKDHNLAVNVDKFMDHYSANGWMAGKVRMQDWQAACRNWTRNEFSSTEKKGVDPLEGIPLEWRTRK